MALLSANDGIFTHAEKVKSTSSFTFRELISPIATLSSTLSKLHPFPDLPEIVQFIPVPFALDVVPLLPLPEVSTIVCPFPETLSSIFHSPTGALHEVASPGTQYSRPEAKLAPVPPTPVDFAPITCALP